MKWFYKSDCIKCFDKQHYKEKKNTEVHWMGDFCLAPQNCSLIENTSDAITFIFHITFSALLGPLVAFCLIMYFFWH